MKNYLTIIAILAVTLLTVGCGERANDKSAASAKPVAVKVLRVARADIPRLCEVPGTVVPREQALVSARVMGTIASADFAIGQRVAQGQILVVLSAPEMLARVDQAQAALDKAQRDFDRESGLLASGATTEQTVHDMAEALRMAQAAFAEAQSLNSYAKVAAPFNGRITRKLVNAGDFAASGTPLFEIDGENGLRVEASVPESFPEMEIGTILKVGDEGRESVGTLAEFSPAADPQSRTRLVKVDMNDDSVLRSGQFVRLFWPVGTLQELLVPVSSVSRYGQIQRVYVAEEGRAKLRIVRTGETHGEMVQILSGLADGDNVIVNLPAGIENGQSVEVR